MENTFSLDELEKAFALLDETEKAFGLLKAENARVLAETMGNTFVLVITNIGQAKIANAILSGSPSLITQAAVGDGNGAFYTPNVYQTSLQNEVWRGEIASAEIDVEEANMINVRFVLPHDVGGFVVREAGLFDDEGDLIAVCNLPDTQKAVYTSGSVGSLTILMRLVVTDSSALQFIVNPSLISVSQEELEAALNNHNNDPNAHILILSAINTIVNRLDNDFYTQPETDQRISDDINTHNIDPLSHGDIRMELASIDARLAIQEIITGGGISSNPFVVTFSTLDGLTVSGIWNNMLGRIEF